MRRLLAGVLLIAAVACDRATAPVPDSRIGGFWSLDGNIPGSSTVVRLTLADDGTLTGTGTWQGEAGPNGSVSATGTIHDGQVALDLTYTYAPAFGGGQGRTSHFEGSLKTETQLSGSFILSGEPPEPASFTKFVPAD